jgi:hypothetical protein
MLEMCCQKQWHIITQNKLVIFFPKYLYVTKGDMCSQGKMPEPDLNYIPLNYILETFKKLNVKNRRAIVRVCGCDCSSVFNVELCMCVRVCKLHIPFCTAIIEKGKAMFGSLQARHCSLCPEDVCAKWHSSNTETLHQY